MASTEHGMSWLQFCDCWHGQWLILARGLAKIREIQEAAKSG